MNLLAGVWVLVRALLRGAVESEEDEDNESEEAVGEESAEGGMSRYPGGVVVGKAARVRAEKRPRQVSVLV